MKKLLTTVAAVGFASMLYANHAEAAPVSGVVEVKANQLFLRSAPDFNAPDIRTLYKGSKWKVFAEENGMYNLGGNQWVTASSKYVTFTPDGVSNNGSVSTNKQVEVIVDSLFVRSGPSFDAKAVDVLRKGAKETVYEEKNGLYRIGDGRWITSVSKYVRDANGSGNVVTPQPPVNNGNGNTQTNVKAIEVIVDSLFVRSGPSFDANTVDVVNKGKRLPVLEERNGLYRIGDGRWITSVSKYVKPVDSVNGGGNVVTPPTKPNTNGNANAEQIMSYAKQFIGTPYVWAASSPGGFDCSGFIYYVFKKNGYDIDRTNVEGYWNQVQRLSSPQPGDLVFFQNTYRIGPSHIGIYLGNGQYIEANSTYGVKISSMNSNWSNKHFLGYGRL